MIRKAEDIDRFGEISVLVVDPAYHKLGICNQLLEFSERLSIELNRKGTWLVRGLGREEKPHQFYKSLEYEPTGYQFMKQIGSKIK